MTASTQMPRRALAQPPTILLYFFDLNDQRILVIVCVCVVVFHAGRRHQQNCNHEKLSLFRVRTTIKYNSIFRASSLYTHILMVEVAALQLHVS